MISKASYYKRKFNGWFWWANLLFSLFIFGGLYIVLNSSLFLSRVSSLILSLGLSHRRLSALLTVILLYGQDFLWGYALTFAVALLMKDSKPQLRRSFAYTILIELGVLLLMLVSRPMYALAPLHILTMFFGDLSAALFIIFHEGME